MVGEESPSVQGGFLVPCILLMLQSGPRTSEELRELVGAFGFRRQAAEIEAALARLRHERLVDGGWWGVDGGQRGDGASSEDGPPLELTPAGRQWLTDRGTALAEPARLVARFLERYTGSDEQRSSPVRGGSADAVGRDEGAERRGRPSPGGPRDGCRTGG